ncbi:MAG: hypothetical protein K8U57_00570 [Planctomycetes bacterium]|nr:hypothetical protein [Planctomycetota bacterium]
MSDSAQQSSPLQAQPRSVFSRIFGLLLPSDKNQSDTKPRRRGPRVVAGLFVVLLLGVWFAPSIIAKTTLRNRIARGATADLNGTLDIGNASLGWFSNVELRDITLTDPQGRVVARIAKVTTSRTLFSLARDHSDLGEISIDHPAIEIVCEKNTTNLEAVLQKLLADSGVTPGPTRTPIKLKITDGTLTLRDTDTSRFSEFRDLAATISIPAARSEPLTATLTANAPNPVAADVSIGDVGRIKFAANSFAMESLSPLLRRIDPTLSVAGTLTTDITATWGQDAASIDGTLGVKNLAVAGASLNGDTVRLASVELPIHATLAGRTITIQRAELTTDIGTASVVGTFDPASFDKLLDRPGIKVAANVDMAKLAAVLPKLLQIREGTEVREGKLIVDVASAAGPDGTAWSGNINASALKATRDGNDVHWEEPLSIEFAGRVKTGQLPTFDKLICKSDFIAINAKVSPDSVRAAANVYLDRLAVRLSEFVDLRGITLDGQASAAVVAIRQPTSDFKVDATVELKQFACVGKSGKGLREPALKLQLTAAGKAPPDKPVAVFTALIVGTAGADEVDLELHDPIADVKQLSSGTFDARVTGNLGRWKRRIAPAVPVLEDYVMDGRAEARGTIRFAPNAVHIDQLTLAVENVKFVGAGLDIDEPSMNAVADLTIDSTTNVTTFDKFNITSNPLTVTKGILVIETPKGGQTVVKGGGPAVSNLNRLGKSVGMYLDAHGPSAMFGKGTGPVHFNYSGDVTTFIGHLDIVNFVLGLRTDPAWTDPTMRLEVNGSYTRSTDMVSFNAAKIERPGLVLAAAGTIGKFETTTDTNLAGTLTYDMVKLTPKFRELFGPNFTATGQGSKPISFVGSLTPPIKPGTKIAPSPLANAMGEFGIGWDSVLTHGFTMGPGAFQVKLANGIADVSPITGTFGGGKIALHPTLRLAPPPGEMTFARGFIVDNAKLTPAVLAGALGHAIPVASNSSTAEGEISVKLDENHIPLADPRQATIKGTLVIHKATMTASPFVTEVAKLLGAANGTMTLANEQSVPVRIERGRVYHENLNIKVGGYIVKTTGSVGFDNTLDMVADVPIPGGLPGFKNAPGLAKALTGKRVQIPIKGTLEKPMLDPKFFQNAIAKVAQDAAKDLGTAAMNKEFEKLFPGMTVPGTTNAGGLFQLFQRK